MCGICGVYILESQELPNIARALDSEGLDGNRLVEKGAAAAGVLFFLLKHLNHRGHDSTGIVTYDGKKPHFYRGMGFAEDNFNQENLESLIGYVGIGNDRYATTGLPKRENIQPFILNLENILGNSEFRLAVSHNGNITNEKDLRQIVIEEEQKLFGESLLTSTTDSELILHMIGLEVYKNPKNKFENSIIKNLNEVRGAYSIALLINDNLIGLRDLYGFWPLNMAKLGNLIMFSSEEMPINRFIEASDYSLKSSDYIKEIERGKIELITKNNGIPNHTFRIQIKQEMNCSFDYAYLRSHEDHEIKNFRETSGKILWKLFPVEADYVVSVPKSGIYYAMGLSNESGIPYRQLIGVNERYKNTAYRTFLEPKNRLKNAGTKYTFEDSYEGLKIILTDDSIVRNITTRYLIKEMRKRNIAEIHARLGTPAIKTPCYLGIHTPTKKELIANYLTEEETERYFECIFYGVDYRIDKLASLILKGVPTEDIVKRSVTDGKNYIENEEMRNIKLGQFSLRYMPLENSDNTQNYSFKHAFDLAGLNSTTKCYACMTQNGRGYPEEIRNDLMSILKS